MTDKPREHTPAEPLVMLFPCKFQMDAEGQSILVYSEDRTSVYATISNPQAVKTLAKELKLKPLTKAYAAAKVHKGLLELGPRLKKQGW